MLIIFQVLGILLHLEERNYKFSGLGFIGFYHQAHAYEILDRSVGNEMKLKEAIMLMKIMRGFGQSQIENNFVLI